MKRKQNVYEQKEVVIFSCVFHPEPIISAETSVQISRDLVFQGYSVKIITSFPGRPSGKIYPGYRRSLYNRQRSPEGYDIIRCFSIPSSSSSTTSRLLENLVFGFTSAAYLALAPRPRVIYSNTWPIFATGLMALVAGLRRIPYVISVQDIYPESFLSQGRGNRNGLAYRIMHWIDRQIAAHASHIIVISEAFADVYVQDRGIPRDRISVVPNWVDGDEAACNVEDAASLRHQFSIPQDGFLAAYGGNVGVAAGVDTFVRAFAHLGQNVYGLVAGDGSELGSCRKLAGELPARQVFFLNPWPVELTMPLYQAADLLVLPTRGSQSMASVPSKMIRYMLSGRPIIASGLPDSDLARLIEASRCGWLIPPDDPLVMAEKIDQVRNLSREELQQRGEAGRSYAMKHLTSQVCLPKVIEIIRKSAAGRQSIKNRM